MFRDKATGLGQLLKANPIPATAAFGDACAGELPHHVLTDPAHDEIVAANTAGLQAKKAKPHPNGYQS